MILYRHTPPALPFLWETPEQPPGRWHGEGEGPAHYLADTPDGAWAEFLRHEDITRPGELAGIDRAIWAVEVPNEAVAAATELGRRLLVVGRGPEEARLLLLRRLLRLLGALAS